jgi:hypothetical protein
MLTRELAQRIAGVVASDPRCRARIGNHAKLPRLTEWGVAGAVRNTAMLLLWREAGTPEFDHYSCVGITEATTEAITKVAVAGARQSAQQPLLPEVRHSTGIYRVVDGTHHQSSWVVMQDGSDYVFDWHKSLEVMDPYIYRTADWRENVHGVLLRHFAGLDV